MTEMLLVRAPEEGGAQAMARDDALFELLASAGARFALRLHGWSRPTLTIGRGQRPPAALLGDSRDRAVDVVRRPTGGGWLLHLPGDFTATVAFAAPLRAGELRGAARSVALAYGAALEELGHGARVVAHPASAPGRAEICFQRADREEVVAGKVKVAGVALARVGRGALVQSAVPLTAPEAGLVPFCRRWDPSRAETTEKLRGVRRAELAEALVRGLSQALGAAVREVPWPEGAEGFAARRETLRYRSAAFQPAATGANGGDPVAEGSR